jgi:outer membrane protein
MSSRTILFGEEKRQMIGRLYRTCLALCLVALMTVGPVAPVYAQQQQGPPATPPAQPAPAQSQPPAPGTRVIKVSDQNYSVPTRWFPNVLLPYEAAHVPDPVLVNSPTIDQLISNGKLVLSLQDAVDLGLQNNLDITIQRYGPWIAEANILRTKGGGVPRATTGGVGAFGNLPTLSFDPTVTATASMDNKDLPANNPLTAGSGTASGSTFGVVNTHTDIGNVQYAQSFHTGTSFTASFNNTRQSTTTSTVFFDPAILTTFTVTANQPLLNGFGLLPNERYIRLARINKNISDLTFEQQVITSITAIANAYWELVFARGNVGVNQESVTLAQQLYDDNKKQVEIGTLAPLEIIRAEAQLASAQQGLIAAQTVQIQDQIVLLNLITKNPGAPELLNIEVVPTDSAATPPPTLETIPLTDAIKEATTNRPDVLQAGDTIQGDDINVRATKNALLPTLNLSGLYTGNGLAGNFAGKPANPSATPPTPAIPPFDSGLGTAFSGELRAIYPEYNAALTLTIPIRNRQAQADSAMAQLTIHQDQARYTQVVASAINDVHNAQVTFALDRIAVDAAVKTRVLQQETLDAEQKKFALGASTIFLIVTDQQALAVAAAAEVRAQVNLAEAKVNFDRALARTLNAYNISIANAKSGAVPKDTLIPGTTTNGQLVGNTIGAGLSFTPAEGAAGQK